MTFEDHRERVVLRRLLAMYMQGHQEVDGRWYAPDECGEPHYLNDDATPEEARILASVRAEYQIHEAAR